jgi:hypothetical protein
MGTSATGLHPLKALPLNTYPGCLACTTTSTTTYLGAARDPMQTDTLKSKASLYILNLSETIPAPRPTPIKPFADIHSTTTHPQINQHRSIVTPRGVRQPTDTTPNHTRKRTAKVDHAKIDHLRTSEHTHSHKHTHTHMLCFIFWASNIFVYNGP